MADLKKQIAAHNILHKEIESYNNQLCPGSASSQVSSFHQLDNFFVTKTCIPHYLKPLLWGKIKEHS